MNGFPYALLYGDSKFGGVGLKRLSDTITIDKLRNLYACLQSDHFTASASNGSILQSSETTILKNKARPIPQTGGSERRHLLHEEHTGMGKGD